MVFLVTYPEARPSSMPCNEESKQSLYRACCKGYGTMWNILWILRGSRVEHTEQDHSLQTFSHVLDVSRK